MFGREHGAGVRRDSGPQERSNSSCDMLWQLLVQPVEWAALWHNHGWVWELQQRRKLQVAYCFSFNHTPFFLLLQY
jgi:hypothetical protein